MNLNIDPANPPRILLVEDDLLAQRITSMLLTSLGCHVETASTGEEALLKANQTYELIFMDIGLPDKDGIEVTHEIRKRCSAEQLPILALTAHIENERRESCFAAGINDILKKPASKEDLALAISQYLSKTVAH